MPRPQGATRRTVLALLVAGAASRAHANEDAVVIFAAMTLKDALDQVAALYRAKGPAEVTISYGPTAALVRQIDSGAGADVFFSADADWMDYAQRHDLIQPESRTDLLTSRLVLIGPRNAPALSIGRTTDLAGLLGDGRLAVCDPAAMPAGRYAKAALEALGLWQQVANRIAIAQTVRSAVLDVARQETPLGIVFDTDAGLDPEVKVIGTFPHDSYPPIVYPVALTRGARPAASAFLKFLLGPEAATVFRRAGYGLQRS